MHLPWQNLPLQFEPNIQRRLESVKSLGEIWDQFALKATPLTVNRALLSWSEGPYQLEHMFRIPTPKEVLNQQKQGRRCVTTLTEESRIKNYILGERDALSFTMHDLIHADHFYFHNDCYQGQLGFYGLLDQCMMASYFDELIPNEKFAYEFEYLIADMNAYAIHLLKCLKSALIHYHPHKNEFFMKWANLITIDQNVLSALEKLNTDAYDGTLHDSILLKFLESKRHFP